MERVISISLLCSLLLVDVLGQYYLRFDYGFHRDRVYGSGETLRCRGYDRKFYRQNSTAKIIIGQNLVNGTHIELSSCPMIRKTRCSAKLVNGGCGRVNLTCSIVRNETEERKITREVLIADEASIESFYIRHKGVNNENATQFFPSESLIKVVCRGDVSTFNYEVLENLTLTWAWGNGFLKFQDPPSVQTTRIFDEHCKVSQTVTSFLSLKGEQLDTVISCETAYSHRYFSGRRMQRKSIRIKTIPEVGQILGPVVVITDELEDRSLLSLTCKTTDLYNSTGVEDIKWCIIKENNTQFIPLPLQQDPLLESFNISKEKTLKSSVLYQFLKSDENVEITCEANHSNTCGSGTLRGKVRLNSHSVEKTNNFLQNNKNFAKDDTRVVYVDSDQPYTLIYVSVSLMIASFIILITAVVAFCKAKKRVKYKTSKTSLNAAAANKVDLRKPKANAFTSNRNKPVSDMHQNQISSGDQTYSNALAHLDGATIDVYETTEGSEKGNMYEPLEVHDIEQHVYEEKLKTSDVYEEV